MQAICTNIRITAKPIIADYIGQYCIEAIEFENLSLGTLPPTIHGELVWISIRNIRKPYLKLHLIDFECWIHLDVCLGRNEGLRD